MKSEFDIILQDYNSIPDDKVNKNRAYYKAIMDTLPRYIQMFVGDKWLVMGACGQGTKALNPGIYIFDPNMSNTPTFGLYVVYLFRSDMSGFYLALSQGFTAFKEKYSRAADLAAEKMANLFKRRINNNYFSKDRINLGPNKTNLGYGYEMATVISKYYPFDDYDEKGLRLDLEKILDVYENLNISKFEYSAILDNIL